MFPPTRLSVVERLTSADPAERQIAWDALVIAYWRPVYKYLRARWRLSPDAAEDLTQDFFARAFEKGFLEELRPVQGALPHVAAHVSRRRGGACA